MMLASFQTVSLHPDSLVSATTPDTVLPTPVAIDTSLIIVKPDTFLKDSIAIAGEKDSIPVPGKKDSTKGVSEKQNQETIKIKDSLVLPFPLPPSHDTMVLDEVISPDSVFHDCTKVVIQLKPDTEISVTVPGKNSEEKFPIHERPEPYNLWIVFLFLAIFSMLAWVRVYYFKRIKQLFEAFASNRYISQLVREEFVFSHPSSIVLSIVFLLNGSFLLMQANVNFGWNVFTSGISAEEATRISVFLKFLFSLTLLYLGKMMIIRFSAFLFSAREEIVEYLFNMFLFNNILGILLLPFTVSVVFATVFPVQHILLFSGGVVLLAFIFRLLKCGYIGSITTKFSKWYIILYICTLEILPLFVVIRVFAARN